MNLGLGLGLIMTSGGAGSIPPVLFAGTRLHTPRGSQSGASDHVTIVANATDDNVTANSPSQCGEINIGMPNHAWSNPRFYFGNWYNDTANGATAAGCAKVVERATVKLGATAYEVTFGGNPGFTLAAGVTGIWSDAVPISGSGGELIRFRTADLHNVGDTNAIRQYLNRTAGTSGLLEGQQRMGSGASDYCNFTTHSTLSNRSGGTIYGPYAMIVSGLTESVLAMGDSIVDGLNTNQLGEGTDARGRRGWVEFGLDGTDQGSRSVAYWKSGIPGATSAAYTGTGLNGLKDIVNGAKAITGTYPMTKMLLNIGINDTKTNTTVWQTSMSGAVSALKTAFPAIPIVHCMAPIRTNTTDGYATILHQSFVTGYEWNSSSDNAWTMWTWMKSTFAGADAYIDFMPWYDGVDNLIYPPAATETAVRGKFNPYFTDGVGAVGVFTEGLHPKDQAAAKYIGRNPIALAKNAGTI